MRTRDELRRRTAADIRAKDLIRIVQIRKNEVELGKVINQFFRKLALPGKEPRKLPRLDGTDFVDQSTCLGELNDMRIAQHFQVRVRELLAKGGNRREGQDKIADGATPDYQDLSPQGAHT